MKLNEMRQLLAERGIKLTKSLGQNFLHDGNQLRRIVAQADLQPTDRVLEIGPGLGPLTEILLASAGHVLAIEKDRHLSEILVARFSRDRPLTVIQEDAMDYLRRARPDWTGWKLVSNMPYSVASPILVELAQAARPPETLVTTVQLEVAQRLTAQRGQPEYGILSLLVQLCYEVQICFRIPATCFFPEPQVDSACVRLKLRTQALLPAAWRPAFERVVKRCFSQRRKMMIKLLKADWPAPSLPAVFEQLGLSRQVRAEEVSLPQFVELTQILRRNSACVHPS